MAALSIVVVNWNGVGHLRRNLLSVVEAARRARVPCEVIVVDNASTDDGVAFVRQTFPSVRVVERPTNEGFIGGNNAGAMASKGRLIVFLNNDVEVEPDFLEPLLPHFASSDVFAVGCQMLVREGIRKETGRTRGWVRFGLPVVEHIREEFSVPLGTLYACGAAMMVDREKFLTLGGFHPIFQPFYWEDTDLSYRAWQRGWRVVFEPRSVVYHMHRGSIGRLPKRFIATVLERNRLLFVWSNWRDHQLLFQHLSWLPWYLLKGLVMLNVPRLLGFLGALQRLPQAIAKRRSMTPGLQRTDADVLAMSYGPFTYQKHYDRIVRPSQKPLHVLVLCPYLPVDGIHGGAVRMFRVIQELTRRHVVDVVSFITPEEEPHLPALQKVCHRAETVLRRYPWCPDLLGLASTMVDEFDYQPMRHLVRRLLVEESYDVLQCEYLLMASYAPSGRTRFARVLTEHQVHFAARAREVPYMPWWRKPRGAGSTIKGLATETALCERFDAVVTMSELDRRALQWWLPRQRIEAIPLGADLEHFRPQPETQPRWDMVFLGYFRHAPNIDAVLWYAQEVWPRIRRARPSATWVIVGYDPPPEIVALGQRPGIAVAGSVTDVRPYLAQSRLFVMPIRLGRGLRVKLAEAWAMGLPVVTTTIGCEGYPVVSGDDVVIADRPEAFAKAVVGLLSDPSRAQRIGAAGRRRAETVCNWDRIGRQTEALYLELLGTGQENAYNERLVEVAEADRQELVSLNA